MKNSIAKQYLEVITQIKELEKQKDKLRAELLGVIGESPAIMLDGVMVMQELRERSSLDKEKLIADHGAQFVEQYLKKTQYTELRCKELVKG